MPFVDHDDVVEAFPSNRPDDALGEGNLPGRSRGDEDLANPQAFRVAWSAVLCRILHSGVLQKCAIIGDVAYESLTLRHKSRFICYLKL